MLAGHHDEALDQAADLLATISPTEYFDTVILGALRLAAADADRGAVNRADLKEVCQTTSEVVEQLRDVPGIPLREGASPRRPDGKIVCIPTRGTLNIAFAAAAQATLERSGYDVIRVERDGATQKALGTIDMQGVKVDCLLGLFDDRTIKRVLALRDQMADRWPDTAVIPAGTREDQLIPRSLGELLARIETATT